MCRLVLTTGLWMIIASMAASARNESDGSTDGFCKGKVNGNFVNPSNQNSFYSCSNGLTYILDCQEGLIFKQSCNCCDWPRTRSDGPIKAASARNESDGSTDGFCKGKVNGNYVNPSNQNSFYSCSNGLTYILDCQEGLIFKQSCSCCDWPRTRSDGPIKAASARNESDGSIDGFCKGKVNGNYVNPSNLNSFYSCSNGLTYILDCQEGLIFKPSCSCCDWP